MAERVPAATAVARVGSRVVDLVDARAGARPVVVLLDGRSGSGKTTLARRLTRHLREAGCTVTVLHLDHVYPGWDGLDAASRTVGEQLLPALAEGRSARYVSWSWVHDRPARPVTVRPAQVVLVEGVGSGGRAARALADLLVWVEAPEPVRHRRALDRDGDRYAPHWHRWAAQETRYLDREGPADAADLVVPTAETPSSEAAGAPSLAP